MTLTHKMQAVRYFRCVKPQPSSNIPGASIQVAINDVYTAHCIVCPLCVKVNPELFIQK